MCELAAVTPVDLVPSLRSGRSIALGYRKRKADLAMCQTLLLGELLREKL